MRLRIAYGRVSTAKGEQLSALDTQLAWLRQQACDLVLSDVESGLSVERPEYVRMRRMIEEGRVAEVVATRLDRLGRVASECDALIELCDAMQTAVTTRDDGRITMSTPEDLLLTRLRASLAQGESMKIAQRVRSARKQGELEGKPMRKPCFGYRTSADRKRLEIHPEEGPVALELLQALKASNWRMLPVLERFKGRVPFTSTRALRYWLGNPVIRGAVPYNAITRGQYERIYWDRHEALLSHADYEAMMAVMAVNQRLWGANGNKTMRALTGLCVCSTCGSRLFYIPGRVRVMSLKCNGDLCEFRYKSIRETAILDFAVAELARQAAERLAATVVQAEDPEIGRLKKQIETLEKQNDPDLEEALRLKRQRLEHLQASPAVDLELTQSMTDPRWYDTLSYDELSLLLHCAVNRIVIAKAAPAELILKP